ncbi:ABC-ATPase domain-containing protein [Actinomyces minihominis]|uniref:ABC-ATPase domain-containing protein n=1 Tax=Actinomyces minihominis TaxID=2002838 RepID=UPI000C082DED|nr:ABC-ATPase domain-containing protein [Actinomyces minihominis]
MRKDFSAPSNRRSGQQGRPQRRFDDKPKVGTQSELLSLLRNIDGSSYGAYKRAIGRWDFGAFTVHLDRVQSDPYAPPSSLRVVADPRRMGLPPETYTTAAQRVATGDFLIRSFGEALRDGDGPGPISIVRTTQQILERSAATVSDNEVELRIQVQLPARGRTIQGRRAAQIFEVELPDVAHLVLDFWSPEAKEYRKALLRHVHTYEDHQALQRSLVENNWVAFINDEAILPRESGISQRPMREAIPFVSPQSLRRSVTLPHAGQVEGMAIPPGITVIVGGGYHGKSTVLSAIQHGVYAHIPGDGRELVAALPEAMKIRAADGRPITKVDVSPFINHLPTGGDTRRFSTKNASGSTSQAASIVEALGVSSPLLLIDEDTSATNLMIRDERMRALVATAQEPITPLIDRIEGLAGARHASLSDRGEDEDVSSQSRTSMILVMGGSGAYLDVADLVLQMDAYRCEDVTAKAVDVCAELPRLRTDLPGFPHLTERAPRPSRGGADRPKTRASGLNTITLDRETIDVSDVEQIVDAGQTEAIGWAVRGILERLADGEKPLPELLGELDRLVDSSGLDALTRFGARRFPPFLARPRMVDVAAALNRYRDLSIKTLTTQRDDSLM